VEAAAEEAVPNLTWANPTSTPTGAETSPHDANEQILGSNLDKPFGSMNLSGSSKGNSPNLGGQFDDAEGEESSDDEDAYDSDGNIISDEEYEVYVMEPGEVEEMKRLNNQDSHPADLAPSTPASSKGPWGSKPANAKAAVAVDVDGDLRMEFPSLSSSLAVPYEGSDDEADNGPGTGGEKKDEAESNPVEEAAGAETKDSKFVTFKVEAPSQPKRVYNSFGKYKTLITSTGVGNVKERAAQAHRKKLLEQQEAMANQTSSLEAEEATGALLGKSRILGSGGAAGQSDQVDDDGEGWVTVSNLSTLKASGQSGFGTLNLDANASSAVIAPRGPSPDMRCACATTDFAMQNVILQMGLKLVSVDGNTVRRLKHWVTRCSACFMIYANDDGSGVGDSASGAKLTSRLFCSKCGSDSLERISAGVDGKTGRYILYMNKRRNKAKNTRGTVFSLPKPGKGNRFEGDLLLREDQLMMGAWNQKVRKGGKKVQSMFGSDISDMMGLGDLTKRDDIQVGFGRKNPNSSKFGRERRGKKKTKAANANKACGLRRY
jgi:RNA-binding protein NOB1